MKPLPYISLPLFALLTFTGCATYVTPGPRADLAQLAPEDIRQGFEREASNPFPASIIAVRLQGGGYTNYNLARRGGVRSQGKYAVVLTREVEEESDFERVRNLPQLSNVISLNRMLIPENINDIDDLRGAASRLRADLLFVYTFDTTFFDQDRATPLTVVSLGLAPTRKVTATTTASGLIIDTRTGFIYGAMEATEINDRLSTSWGSRQAADTARLANERSAFKKLIGEFERTWHGIIAQAGDKVDKPLPVQR